MNLYARVRAWMTAYFKSIFTHIHVVCDDFDSEDELTRSQLKLRPHSGMYKTRYERLTANPLEVLCIGHFVAVDCRGRNRNSDLDFFVGRVTSLDSRDPTTCTIAR